MEAINVMDRNHKKECACCPDSISCWDSICRGNEEYKCQRIETQGCNCNPYIDPGDDWVDAAFEIVPTAADIQATILLIIQTVYGGDVAKAPGYIAPPFCIHGYVFHK
jgi:hypothetical protein